MTGSKDNHHIGLRGKMTLSIAIAFVIAAVFFAVLFFFTNRFIDDYFDDNSRWMEITDTKADEFQQYVADNGISLEDEDLIKAWNAKNPGVYLYIYTADATVYETSRSIASYSYESYRPVVFADGMADMSIFYAIDYRYYMIATVTEIVLSVLLFFAIVFRRMKSIVASIRKLEEDIKILEGGGLDHEISVTGNDEIGSLERSLDDMRKALSSNIAREEELTKANADLVTRMAHDLRTPLTSLLLYLDLLEKHKFSKQEEMDKYIKVSREKAENIKNMSDQLFERFLITGGKREESLETVPVRYAFEDILSTFVMTLETQGFNIETELDWSTRKVSVSMNYIQRIIDNICSNILKYADRTKPVSISLRADENSPSDPEGEGRTIILQIGNSVGNRKSDEGGSNIGLTNIELMLSKMNGSLEVEDDGGTFTMIMKIPAVE